ncbi:MAG: transposase [Blastocatellia bacterium]|nr:transposase [Blastocatellia bacterium]
MIFFSTTYNMETKNRRDSVYSIGYHLVWVTKYRRSVLTGEMEKGLKEILK